MDWANNALLGTIIGGLLAIAGGVVGTLLAARSARKTRMEELIAERKVTANAEAYSAIKEVQGRLIQDTIENTARAMAKHEAWFFQARLFLPGKFPDHWMNVRTDIGHYGALILRPGFDEAAANAIHGRITDAMSAAIREIYKDMGVAEMGFSARGGHVA
jgi:hypothetical protein